MSMEALKSLEIDTDEIERIIKCYRSGQKNIIVTGEFSSGKSSFINCFLNRRAFLPYGKTMSRDIENIPPFRPNTFYYKIYHP